MRNPANWTQTRAGKAQLAKAAAVKAAKRAQSAAARRAAPRKRIAARSEIGWERDKEYRKVLAIWRLENPWCVACVLIVGSPVRRHEMDDAHHKRGRGKYLLDTSTWIPVCRAAHNWIGDHPAEAMKLGLIESRLTRKAGVLAQVGEWGKQP